MMSCYISRSSSHITRPSPRGLASFPCYSYAHRLFASIGSSQLSPAEVAEVDMSSVASASTFDEDFASALSPHYQSQTPMVIRGAYVKSDAFYCWKSLDYLNAVVGKESSCYAEIGGSYADNEVEKPEIAFGDYVDYIRHFEDRYGNAEDNWPLDESLERPPPSEIVYLAQNDCPAGLMNDFSIPRLCLDGEFAVKNNVGGGKLYSVMLWFGPRGTVSPLHFDPLDNLLIQMVGRKRVLLYPRTSGIENPEDAAWVYAGSNGNQYNTSPINVEDPNIEQYPLFANAPQAFACTLNPGDLLFIPSKWWHHVRSLSRSVSVNAWWM